ncbi:hypothetical protein OUZ56_011141 [Daphnia magna]|uniref:Uncharacterized protein n=1 Tax=Daphnia magna TaxID=35525 RepID=A0ABQ9YZJ0_9CRUS|nr:hypothetical protein OUZ56_011141 [Daphnia magna]
MLMIDTPKKELVIQPDILVKERIGTPARLALWISAWLLRRKGSGSSLRNETGSSEVKHWHLVRKDRGSNLEADTMVYKLEVYGLSSAPDFVCYFLKLKSGHPVEALTVRISHNNSLLGHDGQEFHIALNHAHQPRIHNFIPSPVQISNDVLAIFG